MEQISALALISGGLDSILAAKVIREQGINVLPYHFKIPFCHRVKKDKSLIDLAEIALSSDIKRVDICDDFLVMLKNPRHGFGANINPCIDCKILMLKKAGEYMQKEGANFIVTGEVLGQRPMSQNRRALEIISKESGLEGYIVRPLSARLLPVTIAEQIGWLNRDKLLSFNGRGRSNQFSLAKEFKVEKFSQPAGGCLLTDPEFTKRLKDLIKYQQLDLDNVELLKLGRHFRLTEEIKLVIGRDQKENEELERYAKKSDVLFVPKNIAGPSGILRGGYRDGILSLAVRIVISYGDASLGQEAILDIIKGKDGSRELTGTACAREDFKVYSI